MNQENPEIPVMTMDEMNLFISQGYWVIKAHSNNEEFDRELNYVIKDKSIGICFGINSPLKENSTDDDIRQSSTYLNQPKKESSRKMVKQFISDVRIGDKVIIGRGATQSLFICKIASTPYFEQNEHNSYKTRRRITYIRKVPEEFERAYLQQTIRYYN